MGGSILIMGWNSHYVVKFSFRGNALIIVGHYFHYEVSGKSHYGVHSTFMEGPLHHNVPHKARPTQRSLGTAAAAGLGITGLTSNKGYKSCKSHGQDCLQGNYMGNYMGIIQVLIRVLLGFTEGA